MTSRYISLLFKASKSNMTLMIILKILVCTLYILRYSAHASNSRYGELRIQNVLLMLHSCSNHVLISGFGVIYYPYHVTK